jgi:hypothetical protein
MKRLWDWLWEMPYNYDINNAGRLFLGAAAVCLLVLLAVGAAAALVSFARWL